MAAKKKSLLDLRDPKVREEFLMGEMSKANQKLMEGGRDSGADSRVGSELQEAHLLASHCREHRRGSGPLDQLHPVLWKPSSLAADPPADPAAAHLQPRGQSVCCPAAAAGSTGERVRVVASFPGPHPSLVPRPPHPSLVPRLHSPASFPGLHTPASFPGLHPSLVPRPPHPSLVPRLHSPASFPGLHTPASFPGPHPSLVPRPPHPSLVPRPPHPSLVPRPPHPSLVPRPPPQLWHENGAK